MKKNEQSLKDPGGIPSSTPACAKWEFQKEKREDQGQKELSEEIMADNFPN